MLKIAEHYEVDLPKQRRKEAMLTTLRTLLARSLPALAVPICSKGDVMATEEAAAGHLLQARSSVPLSDFGELAFELKKLLKPTIDLEDAMQINIPTQFAQSVAREIK